MKCLGTLSGTVYGFVPRCYAQV